jgi:hypothetical protein
MLLYVYFSDTFKYLENGEKESVQIFPPMFYRVSNNVLRLFVLNFQSISDWVWQSDQRDYDLQNMQYE